MSWLAWRQFRAQAALACAAVAVVIVALLITRDHVADAFGPAGTGRLTGAYVWIRLLGTALIGLPAIIGAFWGAPLVARELETRTYRMIWTQSATRTRWLAAKLAVAGIVATAAVTIFATAFTWWAKPIDATGSRISPAQFAQRGIVPVGYALFGLALGTLAGIIVRRTLPAMAASLAGFFVVRIVLQNLVRSRLASTTTVNLPLFGPDGSTGWILSSHTVDAAGHAISAAVGLDNELATACSLTRATPDIDRAFAACAEQLGIRRIATVHANGQFWTLQAAELGLYLVLAGAVLAVCFWWINHRTT